MDRFKYRHIKFADGTEAVVKDTLEVHIFIKPDGNPEAVVTRHNATSYEEARAELAKVIP